MPDGAALGLGLPDDGDDLWHRGHLLNLALIQGNVKFFFQREDKLHVVQGIPCCNRVGGGFGRNSAGVHAHDSGKQGLQLLFKGFAQKASPMLNR